MPEKSENGGLSLNTHQMSFVHTMPEQQSTVILDLRLKKTGAVKSLDYLGAIVFGKLRFSNVFAHTKTKSRRFQIPPV